VKAEEPASRCGVWGITQRQQSWGDLELWKGLTLGQATCRVGEVVLGSLSWCESRFSLLAVRPCATGLSFFVFPVRGK
jgi:hypothetical protein